jgi:transglutaminase-like putative cysteine protease
MRLKIWHKTHYSYSEAPRSLVQRLHLEPAQFASQKTVHWKIDAPGIETGLRYPDAMGNIIHLVTVSAPPPDLEIISSGEVETSSSAGVVRGLEDTVPGAVFLRQTAVTAPSDQIRAMAKEHAHARSELDRAHSLMNAIHGAIAYEVGQSHAHTTAAEAFADARGVCQDQAHIMISMARHLNIPARYVTGYLVTGTGASASAAHAWAELRIPELGWVGFDPANGQCPTEHYVRIAAGLDAASVTPVRGSRRGAAASEEMTVAVSVEIAQQ